ncbi:hypothetical protein LSI54_00585 [Nesterenkonia sp. AY15]|uniref:hypothetical protein n=1 Tax=Nesterenkonia sp. AY15 TaxID=2901139 RepID=UPI001F4C6307|nr:hypothetical protein [Nesterenkonia sp. AY15]MCH8569863.1 hypothetical protein [Nesterenkonia sp. AY15]
MNTRRLTLPSVFMISALALVSCADGASGDGEAAEGETAASAEPTAASDVADDADDTSDGEDEAAPEATVVEPSDRETLAAGGPSPRLAITHDGGVSVLDGASLEVLSEHQAEGFLRVNPAGDGRHFFLSEGETFRLIDGGTWGEPHGDHNDYFTTDPHLSDVTVDGPAPGHVVSHDGVGTLFFDGSGEIHSYELAELSDLDLGADSELETEVAETQEAHHGVAAVFADGGRFETLGDEDGSNGARVLDADGEEVARSEECPGPHGEAAGPEGMIAVGCEDGVMVFDGAEFSKIAAAEEYARIGNLFPAEDSSIFLGDYNTDEDGEEPMTQVALVDAADEEISLVDLDAAYNFRSLARGPEGEALVLAEDGQLHVINAETGEHTDHLEIMEEWTEPEEWQEPSPAIRVVGDIAYITEPDAQALHMVDLGSMEIINSAELDFTPNEIAAVDGRPAEGAAEHEGEHGEDEAHEGHGHTDDEHADGEPAEGEDADDEHDDHDHAEDQPADDEHDDHDH